MPLPSSLPLPAPGRDQTSLGGTLPGTREVSLQFPRVKNPHHHDGVPGQSGGRGTPVTLTTSPRGFRPHPLLPHSVLEPDIGNERTSITFKFIPQAIAR